MSADALVQRVGEVLGRAHALFGDPVDSGAAAAAGAGLRLSRARDSVRAGQGRFAGLSGEFASGYAAFACGYGPPLDAMAGADDRMAAGLDRSAASLRSGRSASASIINGAAADTAGLGPLSNTPAGEKALIAALRSRVAQQQKLLAAYRMRDARMAALLRSLAYVRGRGVGELGTRAGGAGLGGRGRRGWAPLSVPAVPRLGGAQRAHPVALMSRRHRHPDPVGAPGVTAAEAALSRRGSPYVWGAKGPSAFDCSGLTQWSWARAGVQLGGDTYTQITQGVPVAPGDVRAGDLIFPTSSFGEDGRSGPGHVQLAISSTQVVHAPQSGDVVRVAPMPSSFLARRPVPSG